MSKVAGEKVAKRVNTEVVLTLGQISEAVRLAIDAGVVPNIVGRQGVGKSAVPRTIAEQEGWGFVDFRGAQVEPIDLRGPMQIVGDRMFYRPSTQMPGYDQETRPMVTTAAMKELYAKRAELRAAPSSTMQRQQLYLLEQQIQIASPRCERGIFFLDEFNRAPLDVQQALFELLTDRRIGTWILPPGWTVVLASNPSNANFVVTQMEDSAAYDRMTHLFFGKSNDAVDEWTTWLMSQNRSSGAEAMVRFVQGSPARLFGEEEDDFASIKTTPSARSLTWAVAVADAFANSRYSDLSRLAVLAGLMGHAHAQAFIRDYAIPVTAWQLAQDGVEVHRKTLESLSHDQFNMLMYVMGQLIRGGNEKDKRLFEGAADLLVFALATPAYTDTGIGLMRRVLPDQYARAVLDSPHVLATLQKVVGDRYDVCFLRAVALRRELPELIRNAVHGTVAAATTAPKTKSRAKATV